MNPTPLVSQNRDYLERVCKNAGSWFYWIAGVTTVIVVINFCGGSALGYIGLLVPTVLAGDHSHHLWSAIGGVACIFSVAVYGGLGFFASRGSSWAFIIGIVFYAIDAALFALVKQWIGVALHAYVLYSVVRGVGAAKQLAAVRASERAVAADSQPVGAWYSAPSAGTVIQQPILAEPDIRQPSDHS